MFMSRSVQIYELAQARKGAGIAANPCLFIAVKAAMEEDVNSALVAQGIDPHDPRHMVVHLQRFIVDPALA